MQNKQTSEFLHLLGHSSGSAVSCDVFRGGWQPTAISGVLLWRGVLAGGSICLFCLPACFQVPARSAILFYSFCYRTFSKSLQLFSNYVSVSNQYLVNQTATASKREQHGVSL